MDLENLVEVPLPLNVFPEYNDEGEKVTGLLELLGNFSL